MIYQNLKEKIEHHFEYKWQNDRNQALDDEGSSIYEQLPVDVQNTLYREFLYTNFLYQFRATFHIPKDPEENESNEHLSEVFYSWSDQPYREFMMEVLRNLEPRLEVMGTIIFEELDDINEVIFVQKGSVDIGFEVNKKK